METHLISHGSDEADIAKAEAIVEKYGCAKRKLISILQDIQAEYRYLPRNAIKLVASRLGINEIEVFGVATFFKGFTLEPRGEHLVSLCLGTACHVRRAQSILREVTRLLGIKPGRTTKDRKFSLETVNCLGACAIGPVVVIDGEYNGHMSVKKLRDLLCSYGLDISKEVA